MRGGGQLVAREAKESPRAVKHTLRPCCTEKLRRERRREESCSVRRLTPGVLVGATALNAAAYARGGVPNAEATYHRKQGAANCARAKEGVDHGADGNG